MPKIQTIYTPEHYVGDGVTSVLPFTWRILEKTDILVLARDSSGVVTTLVLDTDYTIADADVDTDGGGDVVLTVPATWDTQEIFLIRETAMTQLVEIVEGSVFPAATVTKVFDRLTMMIQDVHYRLRQALKWAKASQLVDVDVPDIIASTALYGDAAGTGLDWQTPEGGGPAAEGIVDVVENDLAVTVAFAAVGSANYVPFLQTNFGGDPEATAITTTGFIATFNVPAPANAKLQYRVYL